MAGTADRDWIAALERSICPLPVLLRIEPIAVGDIWGERYHSTPSHELIHVLGGSAEIQYRKRAISVGPGDTFVIPQGTQHRDVKTHGKQYRVLYTFFEWPAGKSILSRIDTAALIKLSGGPRTHLRMLVRQLESEYMSSSGGASTGRMQLILLELVLALVRYSHPAEGRETESRRALADGRRRKLTEDVQAYLAQHCTDSIGLEELAARFDVSPFHLCRTFTQTFGVSMTDMIARMRIERAAEWLRSGNESVKAAAARSGFSDANYFAKVFRKVMGMSPSEYQASLHSRKRD